jgi:hypothetical protein
MRGFLAHHDNLCTISIGDMVGTKRLVSHHPFNIQNKTTYKCMLCEILELWRVVSGLDIFVYGALDILLCHHGTINCGIHHGIHHIALNAVSNYRISSLDHLVTLNHVHSCRSFLEGRRPGTIARVGRVGGICGMADVVGHLYEVTLQVGGIYDIC